ncbi:MAG: arsenate reductase ArsC [bacterium]|nr:arsenate reductase ArsC [bacterium]MCP5069403.1 arsenate reductase ArsC [bacterium]
MIHLLFVCVENANRSQMAEAFARHHGGVGVMASSAGSKPSGRVNPKAVASMAERGIDLDRHRSTGLESFDGVELDAAVTLGCGDACPNVRARLREDWEIPDPRDMEPEAFARVRDEIERRVLDLLARLQTSEAG